MEDFKISLFENEYKIPFPEYKTLTNTECKVLLNRLSHKYNLEREDIEMELASEHSFYDKANGEDNFKLISTLNDLNIQPMKKVFINWYKFDKIDELFIDDLDRYFDDIWFLSADDIYLFDDTLNWIFSIRHDGCINFIKHYTY